MERFTFTASYKIVPEFPGAPFTRMDAHPDDRRAEKRTCSASPPSRLVSLPLILDITLSLFRLRASPWTLSHLSTPPEMTDRALGGSLCTTARISGQAFEHGLSDEQSDANGESSGFRTVVEIWRSASIPGE